jgi:hypothetical protein
MVVDAAETTATATTTTDQQEQEPSPPSPPPSPPPVTTTMNDDDSPERAGEARVSFAAELGAVTNNWRSVRAEFGLSEQDIFRRSERTMGWLALRIF